jgi:hypothetical protein
VILSPTTKQQVSYHLPSQDIVSILFLFKMSEACFTASATLRTQVKDLISEIPIIRNENGQYQHNVIVVFIGGVKRTFKGLYNLLQPGKGMADLLLEAPNDLNTIKSMDMAEATKILRDAKNDAAKLSKSTSMMEKPAYETQGDTQDEADRCNFAYQAAIRAKEGAAKTITLKVGTDITDLVLRNTNGNDSKGVNKWSLYEVIQAAKQGAIRPGTGDILQQVISALNHHFDFRKKISTNMEQLKAKINRIVAYGITHNDTALALTLLANIEYATNHDWGREFRPVLQDIRRKYNYNHPHDATSINYMLKELTAADTVRALSEAPEPTAKSANAVADSVLLLSQLMRESQEYEDWTASHLTEGRRAPRNPAVVAKAAEGTVAAPGIVMEEETGMPSTRIVLTARSSSAAGSTPTFQTNVAS